MCLKTSEAMKKKRGAENIFLLFMAQEELFALTRWLSWLEHRLVHQRVAGSFLVRAHTWVAGLVPGWGLCRGVGSPWLFLFGIDVSLSPSLKKLVNISLDED